MCAALSQADPKDLKAFIVKTDANELCKMVKSKIYRAEFPTFLNALFGSFSDSALAESKRRKVVETILIGLRKAKVSNSHVNTIVSRIIMDFPQYAALHLVKLMDFCIESILANDDDFMSWKDIIPQLLEVLQDKKHIHQNGTEISGKEYRETVLKSLCNSRFAPEALTSLTTMFCELTLSKEEHQRVVRLLCSRLSDMELNEIPPLVHQLLTLCRHQHGGILIIAICRYFNKQYEEVPDEESQEVSEDIGVATLKEIQEVESTILYHIAQAAHLNHGSIKEYIRSLRNVSNIPEYVLDPFIMALLLNVSGIYEDDSIEILRLSISRKIRDDEKRKQSACVKQVLPDEWKVMGVVYTVILNSVKDRHLVVKGLVELSFTMMGTGVKLGDEAHTTTLWDLGNKILQKLIKKRSDIGPSVLQTLTDKILTGGLAVSRYTNCLAYMCRKLPLVMLDCQVWVITLLEQLLSINGVAATQVIYAVVPLVRISRSIRDALSLVLRKALYSKDTQTRQMAVAGFLQLLKNLKIQALGVLSQTGSSTSVASSVSVYTQVNLEVHSKRVDTDPKLNTLLCHEVLGILKRCFTHEADVKMHLYGGLYDVILMNPELSVYLVDMLLAHFNQYYEPNPDILPPLDLPKCTSIRGAESVLQEPIGHLIFAMQRVYINAVTASSPGIEKLGFILESLCKRMAKSELEHFELEDGIDLLDNIPESQEKLHELRQMMTVYEALIAYRIVTWSKDTVKPAQKVYSLFQGYHRLVTRTKIVNKPKKGDGTKRKVKDASDTTFKKPARAGSLKLPASVLDPDCMCKILSILYCESVPYATSSEAEELRGRELFHRYVLQTCIQIIQHTKQLKNIELQRHKSQYLTKYFEIGRILYANILSKLDELRNFDEQSAVYGLECFKELCDLMSTVFPSEMLGFLKCADSEEPDASLQVKLMQIISTLKISLEIALDEEVGEEAVTRKIPSIIMGTISILASKFSHDDENIIKLLDWLYEVASEKEVDVNVALSIVQLMFSIEDRTTDYGKCINQMSQQLCDIIGTVRADEHSIDHNYKILNERSSLQVHVAICSTIKHKLDNAGWLLSRLKAEQLLATTPGLDVEERREQLRVKERILGCQLCHVAQTLQTLSNVAIAPGPNADAVFKNLQHMYSILGTFAKYFYGKSTSQNPAFQAVGFVPLIKLAGKPLAKNLYQLITHIEENQKTSAKAKTADQLAQRSKVLRETKLIPKVIYEVEQFGKNVLLLSKKTKINLEDHIQYSITRDFRIRNPALQKGLEALNVTTLSTQTTVHNASLDSSVESQNKSENGSDIENDAPTPPPKKKRKSKCDS